MWVIVLAIVLFRWLPVMLTFYAVRASLDCTRCYIISHGSCFWNDRWKSFNVEWVASVVARLEHGSIAQRDRLCQRKIFYCGSISNDTNVWTHIAGFCTSASPWMGQLCWFSCDTGGCGSRVHWYRLSNNLLLWNVWWFCSELTFDASLSSSGFVL